ncbi:hypothetical protein K7432_008448, partial [Basidiobolus ranarum]
LIELREVFSSQHLANDKYNRTLSEVLLEAVRVFQIKQLNSRREIRDLVVFILPEPAVLQLKNDLALAVR